MNVSEGNQRRGADRSQCFRIAAGSAAETRTALEVACAWGYVDAQTTHTASELLDRVVAILWRLTNARP
jgi:four helix bundle protein